MSQIVRDTIAVTLLFAGSITVFFVVRNLDTDGDTVRAIEVNPYAPAIIFRNPRTREPICGILHSADIDTGKIKVAVGDTLYTIRRQQVELIQY